MLELINSLLTVAGFIVSIVGIGILPQSLSQPYRGTAESYNADLQRLQLQSVGFKLIVIGSSISCFGILSGLLVCAHRIVIYNTTHTIQPLQP